MILMLNGWEVRLGQKGKETDVKRVGGETGRERKRD